MRPSSKPVTYIWPGLLSCACASFAVSFLAGVLPNTMISGGSMFFIFMVLSFPASIIAFVIWVAPVHLFLSKKFQLNYFHLLLISIGPSVIVTIGTIVVKSHNRGGLFYGNILEAEKAFSVIALLLGVVASFVFYLTHPYYAEASHRGE